jgi:hypothetical protein
MKTMLRTAVALGAFLLNAPNVCAGVEQDGKLVRAIRWSEVSLPKGGSLAKPGPKDAEVLVLAHAEERPVLFSLLKLENPAIQTKAYALKCEVRYAEVKGDGYLEMWNIFSSDEAGKEDQRFFSRTMGVAGPMGKISGSSGWRAAVLPFNATGTKSQPKSLEMGLFLPGAGKVEIRNVELMEFADPATMFSSLDRAAAAMLAPGTAGAQAESAWLHRNLATLIAIFVPAAAISVAALVWRSKCRSAEERRRMRALDAL